MPDPVLYIEAFFASAFASAVVALAFAFFGAKIRNESWKAPVASALPLIALAAGLLIGYRILRFAWGFPPVNALDRLIEIVLPVTLMIELSACWSFFPRKFIIVLRGILGCCCGFILMHDSVYLTPIDGLIPRSTVAILIVASTLLLAVWTLMLRTSSEQSSPWMAIALAMCIQAGCIAIMLAGYIKGGAAGIPVTASILATTGSICCLQNVRKLQSLAGASLVLLFSLLFIGVFFGALSRSHAIIIFCSPLLCGCTEFLRLRHWPAWKIGCLRLIFVAAPLAVVLFFAYQKFHARMSPLIASAEPHAGEYQQAQDKR